MRKYFPAILCCVFIFTNCEKNPPEPIEDPNKNEIIGYITTPVWTPLFVARGSDATQFTRTVEGNDTIITITGWDSVRTVQLQLVNISLPGTYSFQNADAAEYTGTMATYREGPQSNPTIFYSTTSTNPEILSLRNFDVFSISDSSIQGKLNALLGDTGPYSKVAFDEVMFKGNFEK